jgi:hypothetical protein
MSGRARATGTSSSRRAAWSTSSSPPSSCSWSTRQAGGPLAQNTGEALAALGRAKLGDPAALGALEAAWRLEQDLSQLLKVALEDGHDPDTEPKAFRTLLARAGGVRAFRSLKTKLAKAKVEARGAFEAVVKGIVAHALAPT